VFVDDCGCGCTVSTFADSRGVVTPAPLDEPEPPDDCRGETRELVLFETSIARLVIGEESVHLLTKRQPGNNEPEHSWSVDKKTRKVRLNAATGGLGAMARGSVVSRSDADASFESRGYRYSNQAGWLLRSSPTGEASSLLFELPQFDEGAFVFIVHEGDFYSTSADGILWHARLSSEPAAPAGWDSQGRYDGDDTTGLLGADANAVYWQAGTGRVERTGDSDPLALFQTCR
jgi:hypothetical protein